MIHTAGFAAILKHFSKLTFLIAMPVSGFIPTTLALANTCRTSTIHPLYDFLDAATVSKNDCLDSVFNQLHHWQTGTYSTGLPGYPACSYSLIGPDLVISAGHCPTPRFVGFEFGGGNWRSYPVVDQLASISNFGAGIDFQILRLDGSPGLELGWYAVSDSD